MPDKLPVEAQKIIFDFFESYGADFNTPEERFNAYSKFSEQIAPYLETPYLPDFLDESIGFGLEDWQRKERRRLGKEKD